MLKLLLEHIINGLQYLGTRRTFPWLIGLFAVMLAAHSMTTGWYTDDYFHRLIFDSNPEARQLITCYWPDFDPSQVLMRMFRFIDGIPEHNHRGIDLGQMSWWSSETCRIAFWRPLTAFTHLIDYTFWPQSPALMHLHNILWYALVVFLVAILYRKFLSAGWVLALAALLFAINDGHGITVGWISNRNALVGVAFGLLAFLTHIESYDRKSFKLQVTAVLLFLTALFSAEAGIGVFGYLLSYTLWLDSSTWRAKINRMLPYLAAIIFWRTVYNLLGYGVTESGVYIDPSNNPLQFIFALPVRLAFAIQDIFFWPPANKFIFLSDRTTAMIAFAFMMIFLGFIWLLFPLWRTDSQLRFALTGAVFSAIPFCATLPDSRNWLSANIGSMMTIALILGRLPQLASSAPESFIRRRMRKTVMVGLVGIHAIIAPINFLQTPFIMKETAHRIENVLNLGKSQTLDGAEVVIANTPVAFFNAYIGVVSYYKNRPIPKRILALAQATTPIAISRPDPQTLTVRPKGGFLKPPGGEGRSETISLTNRLLFNFSDRVALFFRDPFKPISLGTEVNLSEVVITITDLNDAGRPAEATFHFGSELANPTRIWLKWNWERWCYEPFQLPRVRETITIY